MFDAVGWASRPFQAHHLALVLGAMPTLSDLRR